MKLLAGVVGWGLVSAGLMTSSCDNSKAMCEKMAARLEECTPKIIEAEMGKMNVPEGAKAAVEEAKKEIEKSTKDSVAEIRKECAAGNFSDADKTRFKGAGDCVAKDCLEFSACLDKIK